MGETALLLQLGEHMDAALNARVHALAAAIRQARLAAVIDIVPAYASVLIEHRPLAPPARDQLHRQLLALANRPGAATPSTLTQGPVHDLPVCYDAAHGPDLPDLARACGLAVHQVIALHTAPVYRVAMTGFAPGFPYLLGLDERLAAPRLAAPRTRVPAGSVGIAGRQTGIYPTQLPGGWQLIGQTPLALFRADDDRQPCLLQPGDRVRLHAIDAAQFDALRATPC